MRSRIAVLHQGFVPSYRRRFFELLAARGAHDYVVFHGDAPRGGSHMASSGPLDFPNVRVNNREIRIGGGRLIYQPVLRRILTGRFDALVVGHEFKFVSSMLLFGLFKAAGKPAILWGHGYHRRDAALLARRGSNLLARAADGYLAYTDSGATRLREAGVPKDRIAVLGNTIDLTPEIAAHGRLANADRAQVKAELGLHSDALTLLFIGRLYARKRVGDLLDLARRLNADAGIGPVEVLIVGDGPDRARLQADAADLPNVRFLGGIYDPAEVAKLMRIATASIMPGSVGLSVNHAFAHGVPVIARPDPLNSPEIDYVRHGQNGLIVEGGLDAYAAAISAFLGDRALQVRLAAGALATRDMLGLDRMVARFDDGVGRAVTRRKRSSVAERDRLLCIF